MTDEELRRTAVRLNNRLGYYAAARTVFKALLLEDSVSMPLPGKPTHGQKKAVLRAMRTIQRVYTTLSRDQIAGFVSMPSGTLAPGTLTTWARVYRM
jgi:hypothetical protein